MAKSFWTVCIGERFVESSDVFGFGSRTCIVYVERVGMMVMVMVTVMMIMIIIIMTRYRDVQCMWTKSTVDIPSSSTTSDNHLDNTVQPTKENKSVEVPIVLLYSENRNYIEGYRVPSFARVLNTYFPYPYYVFCMVLSHL